MIMKEVVSTLLVIGILIAILVLFAFVILLFIWFIDFNTSKDYYPDIKDL